MHRRPLGRGRLLATISALIIVVGCLPPWFTVAGGATGLTALTVNAFTDKGIVVFVGALLVLALVSLPYAAGDKPVALDRTLSFAMLTGVMVGAFVWRVVDLLGIDPTGLRPDLAPGLWLVAIGLLALVRATYEIGRERRV